MRYAFSLVELSIVLVILGLLTGGILAGQNLIRAAELRSVITEYQSYHTALHTFREKYFALPGDMTNAEAFWGTMTNCGAASPSGTGTQTCNGDGDGKIDAPSAASRTGEYFTFWQQLANAGLIEGSYTGIAGTVSTRDHNYGENSPRSRMSSGGWGTRYYNNEGATGSGYSFAINYGNFYEFGTEGDNVGADYVILKSEEAWSIDVKVDDGKPSTGKLYGNRIGSCTTVSNMEDIAAAEYDLTDTAISCSLIITY